MAAISRRSMRWWLLLDAALAVEFLPGDTRAESALHAKRLRTDLLNSAVFDLSLIHI